MTRSQSPRRWPACCPVAVRTTGSSETQAATTSRSEQLGQSSHDDEYEFVTRKRFDNRTAAVWAVPATPASSRPSDKSCDIALANALRGHVPSALIQVAQELRFADLDQTALQPLITALSVPAPNGVGSDTHNAVVLLDWASRFPDDLISQRILKGIEHVDVLPAGTGNDLPGIGDAQNACVDWMREAYPTLLGAFLDKLPELRSAMPALSTTTSRLRETYGTPLAGFNVGIIGHILAEAPGFITALERVGLNRDTTHVLAIPYSSNELAIEAVRRSGVDIQNPDGKRAREEKRWGSCLDANKAFRDQSGRLTFDEIKEEEVRGLLRTMLDEHKKNGLPLLIIDDGGFAARVAKASFLADLPLFRFVEQTTRGTRQARTAELNNTFVIDVAGSKPKKKEGAFVGDTTCETLLIELRSLWAGQVMGKRVAILGYGAIGRGVARALSKMGVEVTVYDPSTNARLRALNDGVSVADNKDGALRGRDAIIGATGFTSLDSREYCLLAPETALVSVSSTDVEWRDSWIEGELALKMEEFAVTGLLSLEPAPEPCPSQVITEHRLSLPASFLHGTPLSRRAVTSNAITRAFDDSLKRDLRGFGGTVRTRTTMSFSSLEEICPTLSQILGEAPTWSTPALDVEIRESLATMSPVRQPVWLINGGYPINLSRRLVSMPARRIQLTLQALIAGAVQAAVVPEAEMLTGVVPLDDKLANWVEEDFSADNPDDYRYSTAV